MEQGKGRKSKIMGKKPVRRPKQKQEGQVGQEPWKEVCQKAITETERLGRGKSMGKKPVRRP